MTRHTTATFDSIDRRQFLRAGVGVAGATAALPVFTGNAAAHMPEKLTIDIKPKSGKNRIVLGRSKTITVAVIQTDRFNPTSKPIRYRFGAPEVVASGGGARPTGSPQLKDINGDGKMDLVLEFPLAETGFDGDEKKGKLIWERGHKGSEHGLAGVGPVTIIGGEPPTATRNMTTGTAAKQTTTTATTKPMTTATTQKPTTQTTTTAESNTTTGATTTAAQGPGFGMLAALGGIASIGTYLFARNSENK